MRYNDFNCGLTCFHQYVLGDLVPLQQYGKLLPGTEPKTNEANIMQTGAFECFVLVTHLVRKLFFPERWNLNPFVLHIFSTH